MSTYKKEAPVSNVLPFEGTIKGYTIKFLNKNLWKVEGYLEFEDLMQEAHAVYLLVVQKYSAVVTTPSHFMSLYKSALRNKLIDHSVKATEYRKEVTYLYDDEGNEVDIVDTLMGACDNDAIFNNLLDKAPEEVRAVVNFVLQKSKTPAEAVTFWKSQEELWKLQDKKKFLGNEYLCSRLGYDHENVDLVGITYEHFQNPAP